MKNNFLQKYINFSFILFSISLFLGMAPTNISFYMLFLGFIIKNFKDKTNPFNNKILNYLIFGFFISIEIINLMHWDFYSIWNFFRQFIKLFSIFIIIDVINDQKKLEQGIMAIIIIAVISVIFSLISLYTKWDLLSRLIRNKYYIVGFGKDWHISYASKLALVLSFLIMYFINKYNQIKFYKKIISLLGIIILIVGIFYSGSRGVMLAFFLSTFLFLFIKKYRFKFIILLLFMFIIGIIVYHTSQNFYSRLQFNDFETTSEFRVKNWIRVLKKWDKFILGCGTGNYSKNIIKVFPKIAKIDLLPCHMHNNILQYYVIYGFLGVVIYLIFWFGILYYIIRINKNYNWITISGIWSIIIFQIAGLTDANWIIATMQFTICFILGIVFNNIEQNQSNF